MNIITENSLRHIITAFFTFLLIPLHSLGQENGTNYIRTKTFLDNMGASFIQETEYFDGIGRSVETVSKGITPSFSDIIVLREYDFTGRDSVCWLPAPFAGNGTYVPPAELKAVISSNSSYGGDASPFRRKFYDSSPLGRLSREEYEGADWQLQGKHVSTEYYTNDQTSFSCRRYEASADGYTIISCGLYPTGMLTVVKTTDEDGRSVMTFKDLHDRIVLQRRMREGGNADTYYVYDGKGNLAAVLPPSAVNYLDGTQPGMLEDYAWFYKYDVRGNCILRKAPGAEPVSYRYDHSGRLIFSQDGIQRTKGKWKFCLYDLFGRETVHGILNTASPPDVSTITVLSSYTSDGIYGGYSSNIGLSATTLLSVNYYDDYRFLSDRQTGLPGRLPLYGTEIGCPRGMVTGSMSAVEGNAGAFVFSAVRYDERGRVIYTGKTDIHGGYSTEDIELDFIGQPLHRRVVHATSGDSIVTEYFYTYDQAGRLMNTQFSLNGAEPVMIADNVYDELGRLQSVSRMENPQLMTQYAYNVRSWTTAISSPLFSQQLYYNESHNGSTPQWGGNISAMDWQAEMTPTGINPQGASPTAGKLRGYSFCYDGLSRLTQADYHENNTRSNRYDTRYTYDLMGNMLTLQRNGLHDDGEFSMIDDLTFEYEGNQVIKVTDAEPDGPYYKDAWHYRDGADAEIEREYDGSGNMVKDLDAGILRIEYNSLNLPKMIRFSDNSKHIYTYDATGKKLRADYHTPILMVEEPQVPDMEEEGQEFVEEEQQEWEHEQEWGEEWEMEEEELIPEEEPEENGEVVEEPMVPEEDNNCKPWIFYDDDDEIPVWNDYFEVPCEVTTVDYCGDFIYVNGTLKKILFPGGYMTFTNDDINQPEYHFYITDHQGNVRVVANQNGEVEQVNHYYPYGGLMGESTNSDAQPYKYNGKELDRHHGLDWYDYGARWYNGYSWTTADPLAEKYYDTSPYVYCLGNPIKYIDPDGREIKPGDFFKTVDAAAIDFGMFYNDNSIRKDREMVSYIVKVKNDKGEVGYTYAPAILGGSDSAELPSRPANAVAFIHTHGGYSENYFNNEFSGVRNQYRLVPEKARTRVKKDDLGIANNHKIYAYVATPNGSLQKYNNKTGVITTISDKLPSDSKDPKRLNKIDASREKHPYKQLDLQVMFHNYIKLYFNSFLHLLN